MKDKFLTAMLNDGRTTVKRQSTDGQSRRHYKQTPLSKRWKVLMTLVFLFTLSIGQMWAADHCTKTISTDGKTCTWNFFDDYSSYTAETIVAKSKAGFENGLYIIAGSKSNCSLNSSKYLSVTGTNDDAYIYVPVPSNAVGTITFTYGGSATGRYTTLLDSEGAATTESVVPNGSGKSNSISLINANVTTETISGADGNKWAKLKVTGGEVKYRIISVTLTTGSYSSASAPTISAPTADQSATYTIGDEIAALTVTASGTPTPTYQWYYNSSASTEGATSLGSSAQLASYTPSNAAVSDLYYYCVVTNSAGSATSHYFHVTVNAPSTPTHAITYNEASLKGQSVSGYPTTYYEGTGIASFAALADVTDWHFNGWDPASISDTEDQDVEVFATWVAAYNVTFSAGDGSGTVPSSFQKWEGAKFNLPGQGEMVAPSGKAFDGWKANGTKYAANAEYTMGNAAVEFVAQWKAVPQTIFHYQWTGSGTQPSVGDVLNGTGGTITVERKAGSTKTLSNESAQFKAGVPDDMKFTGSTSKGIKFGTSDVYFHIALTSGKFKEGDTIKICGYESFLVSSSDASAAGTGDVSSGFTTGVDKDNYEVAWCVIPEVEDCDLYVRRSGNSCGFAAIKVIRPAERPVLSTEITLSDVKVNDASISAANLATLQSSHSLALSDEFAAAPEIKFNEHTVITYDDELLPATKETDKVYTVTATENGDGKWEASQTINSVAYTVTAEKVSSAKVYYYDGSTKLGEETVAINGNPAEYASYQTKDYATFANWYDNSSLTGDAVSIASAVITKDTTFYGKWDPAYATSINIEQWVLDNKKDNAAFRALLTAQHYQYANLNDVDSLLASKNDGDRNEPYLGQKWKLATSEISFLLKSGSTVRAKFGNVSSNVNIKIGTADPVAKTAAELATPYEYTATEDVIVRLQGTGTGTVVVKQIMIDEPIATVKLHAIVTYNAGTGSFGKTDEKYTGTPLVIGDATPVTDSIFAGWYLGEDQINAAAYEPTKNVTLVAHYAPVEYAINYDGNGETSGSMSAGTAGWGTLVTPAANAFEKTGNVFAGWVITKTSDGSATGITFSEGKFEMPKYDVTLVAQWEDNSKVAQIVETNVKYESFADAIAAVQADQTIQLLQNCSYDTYWDLAVAGTVTLDLNGHDLTYTGAKRGVQVESGAKLVLVDGTATVAPTIDLTASPMARTAISYTSGTFDSKDGMCALAGSEIIVNSGRYLATEGVILVKGPAATATVNDGVLICRDNSVVSGNGTNSADYRNYVMNIHGGILYGEIFSTGYASMVVYHPNVGELNIDGGILVSTNGPCVVTRGGETNITGGTLVALGSGSGKCGDASLVLPAVGIAVDFKSAYPGVASTDVNIGGTVDVTGQAGAVQAIYAGANPTSAEVNAIGVSGGTFNTALTNAVCAEGYVPSPEVAPGVYTVVPKDGVCIIKATTNNVVTGLIGGTIDQSFSGNADSRKLNKSTYFGVTLANSETFQEGDVMIVNITTAADLGKFMVYADAARTQLVADQGIVYTKAVPSSTGEMSITLPAAANGKTSLYLSREDGDTQWNVTFSYVEVKRPMKPMLTAITIDGRDGVINEAAKTVAVTIPYESVLSSLTVVPTIVWNEAAASNSIVVNDGSAWIEGANTYKLTDKDGDYTVYTITLTRDVLKHTVSFNTHGGSAVANVLVEDGSYLAAAPAEPTKEDYLFQGWAETADGAIVDVTTFAITADKEFHAVWAADGAIKLINGTTYNHIDFLTGTKETTVTISEVEYNCVDFTTAGSNRTTVQSISNLNEFIQYNAKTSAAKMSLKLYNSHSSAVSVYLHKLEEGADAATTEEISVPAGEILSTEYYEFNSEKNRSFYITCGNRTYIKVLQVKVIDNGAVAMKQAGQAGYMMNLDHGRLFATTDAMNMEGFEFNLSSAYRPLNASYAKIKESSIVFDVTSPVTLTVTAYNNKTYYVTEGAAGTDNETAKTGASEFNLTAGTWYITGGSSEVQLTNIAFALPKCEKPVITTQPATNHTFDPGDMTATVVVAPVSEGTLHYQWYKKATVGDDEEVGTDDATLTTTVEGTYYVVVTNVLAGHQNVSVTSDEAELGYRVTSDATLMALSYGTPATAITLEDGVYTYAVELAKGTTDVPALAATATMDGYATVTISNAPAFVNYAASSTVTVKSEDATVTNVYTVNFTVKHDLPQVDVTASTVWNWANAATTMQTIKPATKNVEQLMANIDDEGKQLKNDAEFNSQALIFSGQEALTGNNTRWYAKGGHIKFNVTVPGIVEVEFSDNGDNNRRIKINNAVSTEASANNTDVKTYKAYVQPGEVTLMGVQNDGTGVDQYIRISKITFTANPTPDYYRDVTNNIGTLCVDHNVIAGGFLGATFYQIASRNEEYNFKIDFEEVLPNEELKAGEPYIFQSATGRIDLFFGETVAATPVAVRGMIGNYAEGTLAITEGNAADILYIAKNKLWTCEDLIGQNLILNEHRAYIKMSDVPTYAEYQAAQQQQNNAPARRRITLGRNSEQVVTGFENLNAGEQAVKLIIDGKMYILRGEKMYDATGRLVK